MRNLLSLPALPRLEAKEKGGACVAKVSQELTEQVQLALEARFKGVRLTKRAALDCALAEWLTRELERGCEGP